jgi:glycosyl transferase family 25
MSQNLDKIFYINLDKRNDRKDEIEKELTNYNLFNKSERFPAIYTQEQGCVGCSMSHLAVIKIAKERKYKQILILEDDFYFTVSKEEFENQLTIFFDSNISYDICMISYNLNNSTSTEYPFLLKVLDGQTASGYIVHESFYDSLINIYEYAIPQLKETRQHWIYACDQIWKSLQPQSEWFAFNPRCGKQRPSFSDNAKSFVSYDC